MALEALHHFLGIMQGNLPSLTGVFAQLVHFCDDRLCGPPQRIGKVGNGPFLYLDVAPAKEGTDELVDIVLLFEGLKTMESVRFPECGGQFAFGIDGSSGEEQESLGVARGHQVQQAGQIIICHRRAVTAQDPVGVGDVDHTPTGHHRGGTGRNDPLCRARRAAVEGLVVQGFSTPGEEMIQEYFHRTLHQSIGVAMNGDDYGQSILSDGLLPLRKQLVESLGHQFILPRGRWHYATPFDRKQALPIGRQMPYSSGEPGGEKMGREGRRVSGWQKFGVLVRNSFSKGLATGLVGTEVVGEPFVVHQGEALAYALATDDKNPAYFVKSGGLVSPLFAARILKDVLESLILHPRLGMNVLKMVHAEQALVFHQPLRSAETLVPSARISAIRTVSSGQIAEFAVALSQGDDVVVEGMSSMFVRRPAKKGGRGKRERTVDETPWTDVTTFAIAPDQPARYALASQDYNPIHTRPLVARLAGFPRPIAHGLCVMAQATARLVEAFGDSDPARLASVKVRFATPAFPEQELTLQAAGEGQTRQFQLLNPKGRPVLSNGEITFGR